MSFLLENPAFLLAQDYIFGFPAFPGLWVPHTICMALNARATLGPQWRSFARTNPLACYVLTVIYTLCGAIVSSLFLGEPLLAVFANPPMMGSMTASWYLVFYAPFDVFVAAIDTLRLRVPLIAMQDFIRIQIVLGGVKDALRGGSNSLLYAFVFAAVKACAFNHVKFVESIVVNGSILGRRYVIGHHSTKTCVLAALAFAAHQTGHLPGIPIEALFTLLVFLIVGLRLVTSVVDFDPYKPIEAAACAVVFGISDEAETSKLTTNKEPSRSSPRKGLHKKQE